MENIQRVQNDKNYKPTRVCPSPISSIVGSALNQMNLKRSSSAPMINQLVSQTDIRISNTNSTASTPTGPSSHLNINNNNNDSKDLASSSTSDSESTSYANGFLTSLTGSRPRRFSASFSPSSPGLAPSRVSQLRQESTSSTDWESASEKVFHGNANIAQSWEDLSLDSMSMEISHTRRPSFSDQLWLSIGSGSTSMSASSSPTASPRVMQRFSPSLSSPSPTRKSFTSRRSLSPIAIRPSVLDRGVKRKIDQSWDSGSQMDCAPHPAKKIGGLLSLQQYSSQTISSGNTSGNNSVAINMTTTTNHPHPDLQIRHTDSPNSIETESSISSTTSGDNSPFFMPLDSPITDDNSPHPK